MPWYTIIPPRAGHPLGAHAWVPIDDDTCWAWSINYHPKRALTKSEISAMQDGEGIHVKYVPGTFIPLANKSNNYLMDRDAQRAGHSALASSAGARGPRRIALAPLREYLFLKLIPWRANNRQTALRLPAIRRLRIAATTSSSVKSGCSVIRANSQSACSSKGEMLPPVGLAATLPVSSQRRSHFTPELALTSKRSATSRRDAPAIAASSRRIRKSSEQGFGIDHAP
jgi:hypothetical protein